MDYRLLEITRDVINFQVDNENIVSNTKNGIYINELKVLNYNEYNSTQIIDESICFCGNLEEAFVYNFQTNELTQINPKLSYYWNSFENFKVLASGNRRKDDFGNRVADYFYIELTTQNKGIILGVRKPQNIFLKQGILFISENKSLNFCSKIDLSQFWQTSLESYGTIRKVLGVCGENLWLTTSDKTEHSFSNKLLALSIETGTVLYVIDNDYTFDANWVQLLEKEEKIVSIKGSSNQATYLYEYCGKTGAELRKQTIVSLENNGLSIICAKVVENRVYFTATDHTQIVANHVGVMDLEALEVVWFEKVSLGNLKLEPPQVGTGKIYVLGAEGTLHIYEREM